MRTVRAAERDRDAPVHGHRGLDAVAARAGRGYAGLLASTRAARARPSSAQRRSTSSTRGRLVLRRVPDAPRAVAAAAAPNARWPRTTGRARRFRSAWACTPASRRRSTGATSGSTSTGRRGWRRGTAARCWSRRRRARCSTSERLRDLGEHRLKDLSRPSASTSSYRGPARASSRRCARSTPADQPAGAADALSAASASSPTRGRCSAGRRAAAHADRPRRHRQDAPGAAGRGRRARPVPRRRLLRRARRRSATASWSRRRSRRRSACERAGRARRSRR